MERRDFLKPGVAGVAMPAVVTLSPCKIEGGHYHEKHV
jgi:hypothetical protein